MCFVLTPFHFSSIILFFPLKSSTFSHVMNIERISQILIVLTITYFLLGKKKKRKIIKLYFALFFIPIIYQLSSKVTSSKIANAISTELFYVEYTSASAIRNREGIPGKELKLTRRALKISTCTTLSLCLCGHK